MEKTSILDFVTRLGEIAGKKNDEKSKNPSSTTLTSPESQKDAEKLKQPNLLAENNENSFLKTYNPFGEIQKGKSQLNMPKAPKPVKNKIDLSASKNLTKPTQSDGAKNMIDLINRHNAFSAKIKGD